MVENFSINIDCHHKISLEFTVDYNARKVDEKGRGYLKHNKEGIFPEAIETQQYTQRGTRVGTELPCASFHRL
jgi:hypothetical protein